MNHFSSSAHNRLVLAVPRHQAVQNDCVFGGLHSLLRQPPRVLLGIHTTGKQWVVPYCVFRCRRFHRFCHYCFYLGQKKDGNNPDNGFRRRFFFRAAPGLPCCLKSPVSAKTPISVQLLAAFWDCGRNCGLRDKVLPADNR